MLAGFVAWLAWLVIHIFFLIGFRNRFVVMVEWALGVPDLRAQRAHCPEVIDLRLVESPEDPEIERRALTALLLLAAAVAAADPAGKPAAEADPRLRRQRPRPLGDACTDFYQFACGGWLAKNPDARRPARAGGASTSCRSATRTTLREILEKAAETPVRPLDQEIGDFYAACMDENGHRGAGPRRPSSRRSTASPACKSKAELPAEVARLHAPRASSALFAFGSHAGLQGRDQR